VNQLFSVWFHCFVFRAVEHCLVHDIGGPDILMMSVVSVVTFSFSRILTKIIIFIVLVSYYNLTAGKCLPQSYHKSVLQHGSLSRFLEPCLHY
jgi:hypothetical protein